MHYAAPIRLRWVLTYLLPFVVSERIVGLVIDLVICCFDKSKQLEKYYYMYYKQSIHQPRRLDFNLPELVNFCRTTNTKRNKISIHDRHHFFCLVSIFCLL
jgi:hypothetical protein